MAKSEELQRQTQRVLTQMGLPGKPLSADMAKGKTPAEKTLIKFACAIGENPSDWLRYAGKHDFAKTLDAQDPVEVTAEQRMAQQIAQELSGVPQRHHALLLRQIQALIRATHEDTDS